MATKKYYITCVYCGVQELSRENYRAQLSRSNLGWLCPECGALADFYEEQTKCLDGDCAGYVPDTTDICPVCRKNQYDLYYSHTGED